MTAGWRRALRIGLTGAVLLGLWHLADGAGAAALLRAAQPGWLLVALVLLLAQTVLAALRWRLTAAQLGHDLPAGRAVREYLLAQVLNQTLPGGVLGDANRALRAGADAGFERAGQAVLFERLAGQAALLAVACTGALAVTLAPGGITLPAWAGVALAAGAMGLAGLATLPAAGPLRRRMPRLAAWRAAAAQALWAPGVRAAQGALGLAGVAANLLAFAACAAAVGVLLPPAAIAVILPLILFTMLLPLTIAGWGLREGAAVLLFPLAGATGAQGFAASAAFGMVFLISALPGLAMLLRARN